MRVLLHSLLPHFELPLEPRVFSFNGKPDLQKKVGERMRRYVEEPGIEPRFVVLQDNDGADCKGVKARLAALCDKSGRTYQVRVVMQEMEAWMVGDLTAVARAYPDRKVEREAGKARFRDPDRLPKPSEVLTELTGDGRKVGRASQVAPHMDLSANVSHSFRVFCDSVRALADIA